MKTHRRRLGATDDDPLSGVANFFDLGIVFSLGFMLTLATLMGAAPKGKGEAEKARDAFDSKTAKQARLRESNERLRGAGERLGTAYRLANGEVVYVPDQTSAPSKP